MVLGVFKRGIEGHRLLIVPQTLFVSWWARLKSQVELTYYITFRGQHRTAGGHLNEKLFHARHLFT